MSTTPMTGAADLLREVNAYNAKIASGIENLTVEPFTIDGDGYLEIPERPGLGITIDHDKLKRYRR